MSNNIFGNNQYENTLTEKNYPIAIRIRIRLIYDLLNDFYKNFYNNSLDFPEIEINSKQVAALSHVNKIFTSFDQLKNGTFSDIGITLAMAHEMGHILSHKTRYIDLSKKLNLEDHSYDNYDVLIARASEKVADIITGFALKKLEAQGYLSNTDVENGLQNFYNIGRQSTLMSFLGKKLNIHGTGPQRRERVEYGYNMSDKELYQYLNSSILPTYSLINDLIEIKKKILSIFKIHKKTQ